MMKLMASQIDPKSFGLTSRDHLIQLDDGSLALVIKRKSRVIMADGKRILEKINKIRVHRPDIRISLKISAPLCSKTKVFLEKENIQIIQDS